jgi:hypothetical protein
MPPYGSAVVEEEVHHRRDDEQCQQEPENVPTAAGLGNDWGVTYRVANAAEARFVRARAYSETRSSVHEYFDVSRIALGSERPRQFFGHKVFSRKGDELFREVALDLFMSGPFDRLCVRVGRMDGEAASGTALNVESEFKFLILDRELQAGEFGSQAGSDVCLDLLLQFLARGGFERRDCRVAGVGDESTSRLGLDPVDELCHQALEFHLARLYRDFKEGP